MLEQLSININTLHVHACLKRYTALSLSNEVFSPVGFEENFDPLYLVSSTQELPYDYRSIMHFSSTEYSFKYPRQTLAPLNRTVAQLGGSSYPTRLDYLHINLLYCEGTCIYLPL